MQKKEIISLDFMGRGICDLFDDLGLMIVIAESKDEGVACGNTCYFIR